MEVCPAKLDHTYGIVQKGSFTYYKTIASALKVIVDKQFFAFEYL